MVYKKHFYRIIWRNKKRKQFGRSFSREIVITISRNVWLTEDLTWSYYYYGGKAASYTEAYYYTYYWDEECTSNIYARIAQLPDVNAPNWIAAGIKKKK